MKKLITREIAEEFFDGYFDVIDGVDLFIEDQDPEYSLDGNGHIFVLFHS